MKHDLLNMRVLLPKTSDRVLIEIVLFKQIYQTEYFKFEIV